jgi:phosphotransferase system enzyme I (PtsI)
MPLSKVRKINTTTLAPFFVVQARRLTGVKIYKPIAEFARVLNKAGIRRLLVDELAKQALELHGGMCCRDMAEEMKKGRSLYEALMTHLHDRGLEATLRKPTSADAKGVDLIIVGSEGNRKILAKDGCGIVNPPNLLEGIGTSPGIVIGRVKVPEVDIDYIGMSAGEISGMGQRSVEREVEEINGAFDAVMKYYSGLATTKSDSKHQDTMDMERLIGTATQMVSELRTSMVKLLNQGGHPVEAAKKMIGMFESLNIADPKDVGEEKNKDTYDLVKSLLSRCLNIRYGSSGGWLHDIIEGDEGVVLAAKEIDPTSAAEIGARGKGKVLGMATEAGGKITHLTVIAKGLSIPAVTALKGLAGKVKDGDTVLIDGLRGIVIVNPLEEQVSAYQTRIKCYNKAMTVLESEKGMASVTLEGAKIFLGVNVESALEAREGIENNVNGGVMLVRTEYPESIDADGRARVQEATMEERLEFILEIAKPFKEREQDVIFRTIDITRDKKLQFVELMDLERGGAPIQHGLFGLPTGLQLSLIHPVYRGIFKNQIKAFLTAQHLLGNIQVMLPNVYAFSQLKQVREIIKGAKEELAADKINYAKFPLGIMVENTSIIRALRRAVQSNWDRLKSVKPAFLSIGTNDLTSSVLGVDRYDTEVADLYDDQHPEVLKRIMEVFELSQEMDVPLSVCGDMPSNIIGLAILMGIGIERFGIAAGSIPLATHFVRNSTREHAARMVDGMWDITEPEAVRRYVTSSMGELIRENVWAVDRNIFNFFAGESK